MASLGVQTFDATTVKPFQESSTIAEGWYKSRVATSENRVPSKGGPEQLVLTFEIMEAEPKGSRLDLWLGLKSENPKALAASRGKLSAVCHATGKLKLTDSVQLHNSVLYILVKVKRRDDDPNKFTNEISRFASLKEYAEIAAAAKAAPAAGAAPLGGTPAAAKPAQPKAQPKPAPTPEPEPDPEPSAGDDSDPFANET